MTQGDPAQVALCNLPSFPSNKAVLVESQHLGIRANFFPCAHHKSHPKCHPILTLTQSAAMGDSSIDDLKKILDKVSGLEGDLSTFKVDQGRLHIAVNNLQTKKLESGDHSGKDSGTGPGDGSPPLFQHRPTVGNVASHKLRFPKYDGSDDPISWLHRCEQFFRAARTEEDEKVWLASFYMEGDAQLWYYRLERNQGVPTWPRFVELVNLRFGPPTRSNPFGELISLKRTGSVVEYQNAFLQLLARCDGVSEQQQINIFTSGLRNPLQVDVELQQPATLEDAMGLARAFERRLSLGDGDTSDDRAPTATRTTHGSRPALMPPPPLAKPAPSPTSAASSTTCSTPPPASAARPRPAPGTRLVISSARALPVSRPRR